MSITVLLFWVFVAAISLSFISGIEAVAGGEGFFSLLCGLAWMATVVIGLVALGQFVLERA